MMNKKRFKRPFRKMNEGDVVLPNTLTTADFESEDINPALSGSLGNIATYLQEQGTPDYFPDETIEDFSEAQLAGQQSLVGAADTQNALAQTGADVLQGYLTGDAAQGLATEASDAIQGTYFGAGTPGSSRAAQAGANAAAKTISDQRLNALGQIGAQQTNLGTAGNTLNQVGQTQQDQNQAILNEQIKAYNYNQAQPLSSLHQQLALGQIAQAGEAGNIGLDVNQGQSSGGFNLKDIINRGVGAAASSGVNSILDSILNNSGGEIEDFDKDKMKALKKIAEMMDENSPKVTRRG